MELYPTIPVPNYPLTVTPVWNTAISKNGTQRRRRWLYAKYDVVVKYTALESANSKILWAFYMARNGSFEAFYIIDYYAYDHVGLYIATGDSSTTIFDIPGQSTSSRTLYVNGVETATGFTYLSGGGDGSSDRVEFTTAPSLGAIITIDFTGYLRIKCRFANDYLDRVNFTTSLMQYGVELTGL